MWISAAVERECPVNSIFTDLITFSRMLFASSGRLNGRSSRFRVALNANKVTGFFPLLELNSLAYFKNVRHSLGMYGLGGRRRSQYNEFDQKEIVLLVACVHTV